MKVGTFRSLRAGRLTRLIRPLAIGAVLATSIGVSLDRNTAQAQAFPYECSSIFVPNNRTTNAGLWDDGTYTHELWNIALSGTPLGGPDVWLLEPNLYAGESITSQECNDNADGGPRHAPNPAGDEMVITDGELNAADGRRPTGMWLGLQRNDAVAKGAGGQINNGLWQAPGASGAAPDPTFRPPVFQYNWKSASALVDDGGALIIGGNGPDRLIWCSAYVNPGWSHLANNGQCGPDISQGGGTPNGAGSLMNQSNCNLSNPAAADPAFPNDPPDVAQCINPDTFRWIKTPARNENLADVAIGINPLTGELNDFRAHTASRNTVSGGWGVATWVQVDYPNVNFDFTAACGGVSYTATNPLYPTYPGAIPQILFTFNGGSPTPATGPSGTVAKPVGMYGTIQVRGQTNLSGKPFDIIKTMNCLPPPTCEQTYFLPPSGNTYEPGQTIQAAVRITNPQPGWTVNFSIPEIGVNYPGVPIDVPSRTATSPPFVTALTGHHPVSVLVYHTHSEIPNPLNCSTQGDSSTSNSDGDPSTCPPGYPSCPEGVIIRLKPYLKLYGGDILAGSGFTTPSGTCAPANDPAASIISWNRAANFPGDPEPYAGSGTEFAAFALNGITGFASAQSTTTGVGLSFSNNPAWVGGDNFGGHFGGTTAIPCAQDYYNQNGDPSTSGLPNLPATTAIPGAPGLASYYRGGDLTITGGTVTGQVTIYVSGKVSIAGPINFNPGALTDPADYPYLAIIARDNIYIERNVQQVDGLLVAQPNGATGGTIYTCANGFAPVTADVNFHANCNNQLVVNGALVAKQVKFMRSSGTMAQSTTDYWGAGNCVSPVPCTSRAAEVINYSPMLWLNAPPGTAGGTGYSSVVGLPPVL